jgi:hypothetical protein
MEADPAHDEPREAPDDRHHEAPHGGGVEHRTPRVERAQHVAGDAIGLAGEGGRLEAGGHPGLHEAGLDGHRDEAVGAVLVVEALEVVAQAGLAGPVDADRLAAPIPSHA